jgi:2-dehydropantoate 2-reductase
MSTGVSRRVLVVGAGAIGGFLAGLLARAGHSVSVIARGPHADHLERDGLSVLGSDGSEEHLPVDVQRNIRDAAPADWMFVTLKAHQVGPVVSDLAPLARDCTVVIPVHNGVAWWYFMRGGPQAFQGRPVRAVDPDGEIAARMPLDRIIPMFAFKSAEVVSPGVIRHVVSASDRLVLGELDNQSTPRLEELRRSLTASGVQCDCADPRVTMWVKLLGNIFANPLCALSGLDLGTMIDHPEGHAMAIELMEECASVAAAFGVRHDFSFEDRISRSRAVGAAKPSMLQDRLAGRQMETAAILGGLIELGRCSGIDTPRTRALHACLALLERHESRRFAAAAAPGAR